MKKQENQINEKGWGFFGGLVGEISKIGFILSN
jgi:hypothetical protein